MLVTNIKWDSEGYEEMILPTEIELPIGMTDEDEISDWLSDEFGFCHEGFTIVNMELEKPYEFNCNLSEDYKDLTCCDEWGTATLWINGMQGVEYNFCFDGNYNLCAIYKIYYDEENDVEGTDYSTFEHYEIDFDDVNWKENLEKTMYEVAKKFFKS